MGLEVFRAPQDMGHSLASAAPTRAALRCLIAALGDFRNFVFKISVSKKHNESGVVG